jgi:hypothetical protein
VCPPNENGRAPVGASGRFLPEWGLRA